jgi:hypothetical protein
MAGNKKSGLEFSELMDAAVIVAGVVMLVAIVIRYLS